MLLALVVLKFVFICVLELLPLFFEVVEGVVVVSVGGCIGG